jgi:hypothetical protein
LQKLLPPLLQLMLDPLCFLLSQIRKTELMLVLQQDIDFRQ